MWENLVRVPDIVKGQAGLVNLTDVGKFVYHIQDMYKIPKLYPNIKHIYI